MLVLLHGDNDLGIQNRLDQIKADHSGWETVFLDGKTNTVERIIQSFSSQSLFGEDKKLLIITNTFADKTLLGNLPVPEKSFDLIFVEHKKATATQIKDLQEKFGKISVEEAKENSAMFTFVEAIAPNSGLAISILRSQMTDEVPEIIFTMIVRQFRLMLLAATNATEGPDDWKRLSDWQKGKLKTQAKKFTVDQLKSAFSKLAEIDRKIKTGQLPGSLREEMENFLLFL